MEPYRWQPPADRADSKLKTAKKKDHTPPLLYSYSTHHSKAPEKKPVQPRHPTPASTQINSTGPTLHTAEPHAEGKYVPARQKTPGDPARPK